MGLDYKAQGPTFPCEAPPPKDSTALPNSGHQVFKHVNLWGHCIPKPQQATPSLKRPHV